MPEFHEAHPRNIAADGPGSDHPAGGHADIPRIMEIRHAVAENRLGDPTPTTSPHCAAFIDPSEIWVLCESDVVVGFAAGGPRHGRIWALFVASGYEKRGIGRALLALACDTLRRAGYAAATLSTDEGTRAERFYRQNGWGVTGKNHKGELVFRKEL